MKKIHFIGILGSGSFRAALAAKRLGFEVSGCDLKSDTPYSQHILDAGIPVENGHDPKHLDGQDIIAVSPALIEQNIQFPEFDAAMASDKMIKWQDFIGTYILPKMKSAAILATHGKTTTSSILAYILKKAGMTPTCFIGAHVPQLDEDTESGEHRIASETNESEWAVIEADEYANNFQSYRPNFIALNNLEMEHPEYFTDFEHYKSVFRELLSKQSPDTVLFYNAGDKNIPDVLREFKGVIFSYTAGDLGDMTIKLPGDHNRLNAAAATVLARAIGISDDIIRTALAEFKGAGHRMDKIYERDNVAIFDDYAHHYSQAKATITSIRESYWDRKLIVIFEPHQISRYKNDTQATLTALNAADVAIITEFWRGREPHLAIPNVNADIKKYRTIHVKYIPDIDKTIQAAIAEIDGPAVILVMGAGQSYKIANKIKDILLSN